jgi:hypothetical protein
MPDEVHGGSDSPRDQSTEVRLSGLEARVGRIEVTVDEIRKELQALRAEMTALRLDVAEIKGRLQNIPTTFQLVFMLAAFTVATFIRATGLALAVLRLGGAH